MSPPRDAALYSNHCEIAAANIENTTNNNHLNIQSMEKTTNGELEASNASNGPFSEEVIKRIVVEVEDEPVSQDENAITILSGCEKTALQQDPAPPISIRKNSRQDVIDSHRMSDKSSEEASPVSSTLKKGILWQQQNHKKFHERLFNRWKERYFVLTNDYLACFKKSSKVGHSEMGGFLYKAALVDVANLTWADKKKDGVISFHVNRQFSLLLWINQGLDEWMYLIKAAVDRSKGRREILIRETRTLSSTSTSTPTTANNTANTRFTDKNNANSNPGTNQKDSRNLSKQSTSALNNVRHKSTSKSVNPNASLPSPKSERSSIENKKLDSEVDHYLNEAAIVSQRKFEQNGIKKEGPAKFDQANSDANFSSSDGANFTLRNQSDSTKGVRDNDSRLSLASVPRKVDNRQDAGKEGSSPFSLKESVMPRNNAPSSTLSSSDCPKQEHPALTNSSGNSAKPSRSHLIDPLDHLVNRRPPSAATASPSQQLKERSASQEPSSSNMTHNNSQQDSPRASSRKVPHQSINQQQQTNLASPQLNRLRRLQHQYHSEDGSLVLPIINQTPVPEGDNLKDKLNDSSSRSSNVSTLQQQQQQQRKPSDRHNFVAQTGTQAQFQPKLPPRDNLRPLIKRDDSWQSLLSLSRINGPTTQKLQASPGLAERSLHAQHITDSSDSTRTSGYDTASSSKGMSRFLPIKYSRHRASIENCDPSIVNAQSNNQISQLLQHQASLSRFFDRNAIYSQTNSNGRRGSSNNMLVSANANVNPYGYSSARSALKSAASEFSFIRPNSPFLSTLPHPGSRSMHFKEQENGRQHHATIPEQHVLPIQRHTTILTNENLGVKSADHLPMSSIHASIQIHQQQDMNGDKSTTANAPSDIQAPNREFPLKPNQKRASKKQIQKSSSLSSSIASFLGKAFTRGNRTSSKKRDRKSGDALHNQNTFVDIYDEANLSYNPIVNNSGVLDTIVNSVSPAKVQQLQPLPHQPRMVDMIEAFTNHTMLAAQDDQQNDQKSTEELPPTLTANIERQKSHYSKAQAMSEFEALKNQQKSQIKPLDKKCMSPSMHKSNSVVASSGSNITQIDLMMIRQNPMDAGNSHNFHTRIQAYEKSSAAKSRHPPLSSPSRPSSIYGQPSMVSSPVSLIDHRHSYFGNHRNSLHHVRDGTGNLVLMMPSLDTTREVAEDLASPIGEKYPIRFNKDNRVNDNADIINSTQYSSNNSKNILQRRSQVDSSNCAVVSPFHQSPTLNNIYDNHPNLMRPTQDLLYDNQSSLYISSKVSDSMPSHLFMAANNNNNINSFYQQAAPSHISGDNDSYRREGLPSYNIPGSRQSSASVHESSLSIRQNGVINASLISTKPSAIVTPNSPQNKALALCGPTSSSNAIPIRSSLDHQIYNPSTARTMSSGVISPLVVRRNSNYQQSPLVSRSTRASDHITPVPINLIGAPGVKLSPNLAASLLVTPDGLRTDLIDKNSKNAPLIDSNGNSKTFLVSTRLTKSLASANNHVSTPTRYLPQQRQPGSSTDKFFATEAVNATPIKNSTNNNNNIIINKNNDKNRQLNKSRPVQTQIGSGRNQCSRENSSETSGSLTNSSHFSSSDGRADKNRNLRRRHVKTSRHRREDLVDENGYQNTGTDSSTESSIRYSSNTRSGSINSSDALSAANTIDRAWVTSKLLESHLEDTNETLFESERLKLSEYPKPRRTSSIQSERDACIRSDSIGEV